MVDHLLSGIRPGQSKITLKLGALPALLDCTSPVLCKMTYDIFILPREVYGSPMAPFAALWYGG